MEPAATAETLQTPTAESEPKHPLRRLGGIRKLHEFQQALELLFSQEKIWDRSEHVMRAIKNCGTVLKATREQRVTLLRRIEEGATRAGVRFTRMHYNCCIKMACSNDDLDTMVYMVQRMKQRGLDPDVITYTSIVHAYARRGDIASSEHILELMQANGVAPNITTYTCILDAYHAHNDVQRGWDLYQTILKAGLQPVALTYRALIRLFVRDKRTRPHALSLYREMRASGVQPDHVTFMALLRALVEDVNADEATAVFQDCVEVTEQPNSTTFIPSGGRPEVGTEAYNLLIDVYVRAGQLARALSVFDAMCAKGVNRDPRTYNLLLGGCVQAHDTRNGRRMLGHMQRSRVPPTKRTGFLRARLQYLAELREFIDQNVARGGGFEPDTAATATRQNLCRYAPLLSALAYNDPSMDSDHELMVTSA